MRFFAVVLLTLLSLPALAAEKPKNWGLKVDDKTVLSECSDCHFAFPPVLLPARSWKKLIGNLSDHFGEDASLAPKTTKYVRKYMIARAGDKTVKGGYGPYALKWLKDSETPLRITKMPTWLATHYNGVFPNDLKATIGSWINCTGCHKRAADGDYFNWD